MYTATKMAAAKGNTFRLITWALIIPIVLFYGKTNQ